ncbi:MAG: hypothetical protein AAF485_21590 [Chloroflexota bacterium]
MKTPKITTLNPIVLPDNRRITLEMVVDDLPTTFSNLMLTMPDELDGPPTMPAKPDPDAPSPYPNITLSILNSQRQLVASLYIVEHKERFTSLTLHLRTTPDPEEQYTARAEMVHQEETLDIVEIPFTLN